MSDSKSEITGVWLRIAHALRRAAGLPYKENPFIKGTEEAHLPWLGTVVSHIHIQRLQKSEFRASPRKVAAELERLQGDMRRLRRRIKALDQQTRTALHLADERLLEEAQAKDAARGVDEILDVVCLRLLGKAPGEWGVEQKAIERFEAAAARVEKDLKEVAAEQSATKRELTLRKFNIAEIVADYVVTATGKPPTVWKSADSPSPFVGALAEIFEILEFKPGHERAAMHAIKAIGQNPRKYFDFGL